jgi:phage anti-repressor protein
VRGEALERDPTLCALVVRASDMADKPIGLPAGTVRLLAGGMRSVTLPEDVAAALSIRPRPSPRGSVPSVSIRGLWSCTASTRTVTDWFARVVRNLKLVGGEDYAVDPSDSPVFVDLFTARSMVDPNRSQSLAAAAAVIDDAMRSAARAAEGSQADPPISPVKHRPPVEITDHQAPEADRPVYDPAGQEPWAEAFDLGRLVPVAEREVGGVLQPSVIARDVHVFLQPGRNLTTWFQASVASCSLTPSVDFDVMEGVLPGSGQNPRGGRPRVDHALTVHAAKKLALTAGGVRGNAVREYFIEQERRILAGEAPIPGSVDPGIQEPPAASRVLVGMTQDPCPSSSPPSLSCVAYRPPRPVGWPRTTNPCCSRRSPSPDHRRPPAWTPWRAIGSSRGRSSTPGGVPTGSLS